MANASFFDSFNFSNTTPQLISNRILDFVNNINKNSPNNVNVIENVSSFFTNIYNYFLRDNIFLLILLILIGLFLYHRYKNNVVLNKHDKKNTNEIDIDMYINDDDISLDLEDIKLIEQSDSLDQI